MYHHAIETSNYYLFAVVFGGVCQDGAKRDRLRGNETFVIAEEARRIEA
jgi:hypothetical protein